MRVGKNIGLVIMLLVTLAGCKSRRTATEATVNAETVAKYWSTQYESEYLEARGKAAITQNGSTTNVSMHLKLKRDSLIWGKFSLFGIGATVLITPDSFFMVNSLTQEYMAYGNDYLNQYLGFKASVSQIQNILLGNAIFVHDKYSYSGAQSAFISQEGLVTNLLKINDKYRTLNSKILGRDTTQSAIVEYDEYTFLNEQLLPKMVKIDVESRNKQLNVLLNYQNLNTNTISSFPFRIPNGYVRK